jgi:hypothetical protein
LTPQLTPKSPKQADYGCRMVGLVHWLSLRSVRRPAAASSTKARLFLVDHLG